MDALVEIVKRELTVSSGLASLQLQNHLYGCYLVMEDMAQERWKSDVRLLFSQLGIRYGFFLDTKLVLPSKSEYEKEWCQLFDYIMEMKDIDFVDKLEEKLNETILSVVPSHEAFFENALHSGNMSQEWICQALSLLQPSLLVESEKETLFKVKEEDKDKDENKNKKPLIENVQKRFRHTRRQRALSMRHRHKNLVLETH
jgi:hypothetical protein